MKIVELQDISKTYHVGTINIPALKETTLTIERGEFVAIIGR